MKDFYNRPTKSLGSYTISGDGGGYTIEVRSPSKSWWGRRIRSEYFEIPGWNGFSEFREGLEQILSSHLDEKEDLSLHITPSPPWLEIVLAFASTTVATTLITKISEDIYYHFKGKLLKAHDKKETEREILVERLERLKAGKITEDTEQGKLQLSIRIDIGSTTHLDGSFQADNYSDAVDAIRSLPQVLADAEKSQVYEYNVLKKQWIPRNKS